MALPTAFPVPLSPEVVGAAFVGQYYFILHQSPELVHKFYQDSSILTRPNSDGEMSSVTTLQAINDKLLSFSLGKDIAEIETVDSQASYKEGVFIVVTGWMIGTDNVRLKFAQSFFLAPQDDRGYFILNDIFKFVNQSPPSQMFDNGSSEGAPEASLNLEAGPSLVTESHVEDLVTPPTSRDPDSVEICNPSENGDAGAKDEVVVDPPAHSSRSIESLASEMNVSVVQDVTRKSYASIVRIANGSLSQEPVYVSTAEAKPASANLEKLLTVKKTPDPEPNTPAPTSNTVPDNNSHKAVEGHSIYIGNLPLSATIQQVKEEFGKFGYIKADGVQVVNHKDNYFRFGFVEFESLNSMQAAIKASPINFGGRQAFIQEKRTTTRVVNGVVITSNNSSDGGRGRFLPGRDSFRNDNFRGRGGGFESSNRYSKPDFRSRGEYSGRGRGTRGHDGKGYPRGRGTPGHDGEGCPRGRGTSAHDGEGYVQIRTFRHGRGVVSSHKVYQTAW